MKEVIVGWNVDDILNWRPEWSEERAEEFLSKHGGYIVEAMISAGRSEIVDQLAWFELEKEKENG